MPCVPAQRALDSPEPYGSGYNYAPFAVHQREAGDEPAAPAISFNTRTVTKPAKTKPPVIRGDSSYTGLLRDVDLVFTTVALAPGTTTTYSYASTTASPCWPPVTTIYAPTGAALAPELPNWPPILTSFLFAWLGFAWMLAASLYFSQFPAQLEWMGKVVERAVLGLKGNRDEAVDEVRRKKGNNGYVKVLGVDADGVDGDGDSDTRFSSSAKQDATTHLNTEEASTALPSGLGISLPDNDRDHLSAPTIRLRKPRSFNDLETESRDDHEHQPRNRSEHILTHLTAPLPSRLTLSPLAISRSSSRGRVGDTTDLENGLHTPGSSSSNSPDERDRRPNDGKGGGLSAWLESVNAGIESVAGTMARLACGEGAEDGLLLPMRREERERQGLTSVD